MNKIYKPYRKFSKLSNCNMWDANLFGLAGWSHGSAFGISFFASTGAPCNGLRSPFSPYYFFHGFLFSFHLLSFSFFSFLSPFISFRRFLFLLSFSFQFCSHFLRSVEHGQRSQERTWEEITSACLAFHKLRTVHSVHSAAAPPGFARSARARAAHCPRFGMRL